MEGSSVRASHFEIIYGSYLVDVEIGTSDIV